MTYYYYRVSPGEHTNLQLYSLKQAMRYWEELTDEYDRYGESTKDLRERCVFVLASLGLSISQLLGQNNPNPGARVPSSLKIFDDFVDHHGLDQSLKDRFQRFNYFYNGCRHFGRTAGTAGYDRVDQLTYEVAKECYEFGLEVWKTVIAIFRKDSKSELEQFSVRNLDY